ncbi:hypothetical protein [uncultured Veillonella sp.]|uniref:hypothetical protein n=1 Tax=uncultured Veillonella sp. TaxID=159268 RepID=UPI00259ABACB|nr:hypothetical protein [uncultured Veillonella sp.]
MIHEGKEYQSGGWFSGLPGDDTKYTLLFDENSDCFISPMEMEDAVYVWEETKAQNAEEIKKGANKAAIVVGLATAGYLAYRTGVLGKATRWVKDKFRKEDKDDEVVIIDHK